MNGTLLGTALGGRYRLDAQIGRGGMSTVYRAFDTVLERPVAIKLMHREIASDSDQLERFRREARAVAQLSHPHIVTVIDAGEETHADGGSTPYIVFEYVAGETLKELMRRTGPLEITEAIAYAIEIARALGVAHEHFIVHRDVKPQNVLLSGEGDAKITDFGIARTLTEEGLTLDGRVLGTTDYVSPEQALGQAVTGQSDIYSLGVVLYEMLTGTVPFTADTPVAVAMRHVREDVPDVQLARAEVSAATAAVVDRATAKDLQRRYPDVPALLADLEEVLALEAARAGQATGEVTTVLRTLAGRSRRRLPWRMRHPVRWLASLALLGGLIALGLALAADHTRRGTGVPDVGAKPGLSAVSLAANAAHDYNPFGTEPEHPKQVANVLDGDPSTVWSTEHYLDDTLGAKPGTGFYVDAAPGLSARALEIQTPTPGFAAAVYAANRFDGALPFGSSQTLGERGWKQLASAQAIAAQSTLRLDTDGVRYRYYLFWITRLPPGSETAAVSAITLFR
ncbi:MAG TPA: protein kinase [Solirubrobacteraceae bacterium]|jgi:tRNA A-37 threonylcarbamoyl transferase component Bud32|nr:protein kinase [Solirubrobacteraceae bacterium]